MNHFTHGVVRAFAESFDFPEPILEVGSFQVEGQEEVSNLRSFFPGREYQGIDVRPGPGVDLVADVEDLPFPTASVGTVLALNTFEHVPHFWRGLDEIYRVLRSDGVLLVSVPFYFHIHTYPNDYWRFTPAALDIVLDRYPTRLIGCHGPKRRPLGVWAVAFREQATPSPDTIQRYEQALRAHAREPLGWRNWLRYSLGRRLFGSRPFSPYLERDRWSLEVHTDMPTSSGRDLEVRDQKSEVSKATNRPPTSDLRPLTSDS
jgi:SAM-dependent methyltransferase